MDAMIAPQWNTEVFPISLPEFAEDAAALGQAHGLLRSASSGIIRRCASASRCVRTIGDRGVRRSRVAGQAVGRGEERMNERPSLAEIQALVKQAFTLRVSAEQSLELELAEVQDLGVRSTPDGDLNNYSLTFRSPVKDRYARQGTYRLEHATLGAREVFLVPLGPDAQGFRYEAVFN
jgi:hypothetical protein